MEGRAVIWLLVLLLVVAWVVIAWRAAPDDPLDVWSDDYPDSNPPIPAGMQCPKDPPTEEELKTLPGELEHHEDRIH